MAYGSLGYLGFRPDTFSDLQGTLKQFMQPCGEFNATLSGSQIGLFHLSLYSPLANDGRFQSAHHTEEVASHGIRYLPVAVIEFHTVAGLQQHRRSYLIAVQPAEVFLTFCQ